MIGTRNRLKLLFFGTLIAVALIVVLSRTVWSGRLAKGHIIAPQKAIDFGIVDKDAVKSAELTLRNEGKGIVIIKDVMADCGCTVADVDKRKVGPGESIKIHITFNSRGYWRQFAKRVFLNCENNDTPLLVVSVSGYVRIGLRTDVDSLDLGSGIFGKPLRNQEVHLICDPDLVTKELSFVGDTKDLTFEVAEWQPDNEARSRAIRIGRKALDEPPGIYTKEISMCIGNEKLPLTVIYEVRQTLCAEPARVELVQTHPQGIRVTINHSMRVEFGPVGAVFGACEASIVETSDTSTVVQIRPVPRWKTNIDHADFDIVHVSYEVPDLSLRETLNIPVTIAPKEQ